MTLTRFKQRGGSSEQLLDDDEADTATAAARRLDCKLYMLLSDLNVDCNRLSRSRSTSMKSSRVAMLRSRSISRRNLASLSWKPAS